MLTSLGRLVGLPVVWQNRRMGFVERAVPDVDAGRLDGMVVRKGLGMARWSCADDVLCVGKTCVIVRAKPSRMPEREWGELRRAFLTTGVCAGEVTDVLMDAQTLCLRGAEVCQGPLYRLLGQRAYAPQFRLTQSVEAGEVIIPALLSWTQLLEQLGEEDEAWI